MLFEIKDLAPDPAVIPFVFKDQGGGEGILRTG